MFDTTTPSNDYNFNNHDNDATASGRDAEKKAWYFPIVFCYHYYQFYTKWEDN